MILRRCIILPILIAASFFALFIIGIFRAYSPIPISDAWDAALAFFLKSGDWKAWIALYRDHPIILPRILYWIDVRFCGAYMLVPLIGGLAFAIATWYLLFALLRANILDRTRQAIAAATALLFLTSWMQIPNITHGAQAAQEFMSIFFALATFTAIAESQENLRLFYIATICGILAAATMARGLLVLPIAAMLTYCLGLGWKRTLALSSISIILFVAYFFDRQSTVSLGDPVQNGQSFLMYLGNVGFHASVFIFAGLQFVISALLTGHIPAQIGKPDDYPLAADSAMLIAQIFGFSVLITAFVLTLHWLREERKAEEGALIAFIAFATASALATSVGRVAEFGPEVGVQARFTSLMLFALASFTILLVKKLSIRGCLTAFLLIAVLLLPRQLTAVRSRENEHERIEHAMAAVLAGQATEEDRLLLGSPETIQPVAEYLRASHWHGIRANGAH